MNTSSQIHFILGKTRICKQDRNLYVVSQDIDYLFTNIPLDKTIDTCIDSLYDDNENNPRLFVICLT